MVTNGTGGERRIEPAQPATPFEAPVNNNRASYTVDEVRSAYTAMGPSGDVVTRQGFPNTLVVDPASGSPEPYKQWQSIMPLSPTWWRRQDGIQRPHPMFGFGRGGGALPSDIPQDLMKQYKDLIDKPLALPPDASMDPPPEADRRMLDQQALEIAGMIGRFGNLRNDRIEGLFQAATAEGPEHLNYLVSKVNEQLKQNGNPDLQLAYGYDTETAWYSRDTHGADIYYQPKSVEEPRANIELQSTRGRTLTTQDQFTAQVDLVPPGHHRTDDPHRDRIRILE